MKGLGRPKRYYCKADSYMSRSRADHKHDRYKTVGPIPNRNNELVYTIKDMVMKKDVGGEYIEYGKCRDDCKTLNDMDSLIHHFHMLFHEDVFVCDTGKLFHPETDYDFKRYTFKELLEKQNKKIKDQKFIIGWQENEISHLETYNSQLEAENECLELLLEHKLNDFHDGRYEYHDGDGGEYILDTLTGQRFDDIRTLSLLLNNYSLCVRKTLKTK